MDRHLRRWVTDTSLVIGKIVKKCSNNVLSNSKTIQAKFMNNGGKVLELLSIK